MDRGGSGQPVHHGHGDVHDGPVGGEGLERGDGFGAIGGFGEGGAGRFEDAADEIAGGGVIVCDQQTPWCAGVWLFVLSVGGSDVRIMPCRTRFG